LICVLPQALRKVPSVNASWYGDFIRTHHVVDINVAVQTPTGLMVPFVSGADTKTLTAIAADVKALAGKVRLGHASLGSQAP
jgi:pyruvate dehydrogenase E2 component (dihydrolipoamide acetyltransferase)